MKPEVLGLAPSFGFGDRIGLATPGHVDSMKAAGAGIAPIFAQQSIREMARTRRTPALVMSDAIWGAAAAGWNLRQGADADHLKTEQDIDVTVDAGFTFFTLDPSGFVDQKTDHYEESVLREKFRTVESQCLWYREYTGRTVTLPGHGRIEFTEQACMRAAVKYGAAIQHALKLSQYLEQVHQKLGRVYEIELSVDETEQPTTLAEHFIIADQCLRGGMKLVSLAPRFPGDFEKGIDYIGGLDVATRAFHEHAAVAELLGPYKLSLHSGSDKISVYAILSLATKGRFHVKTAGTSYLEALRVVALHNKPLFRAIVRFARRNYGTDRATYHVSAELESTPDPDEVLSDEVLEREYLQRWDSVPDGCGFTRPGRQILHCTFGSTLTENVLGPEIRSVLESHPETYRAVLEEHFVRHLQALRAGL